MKKTLLVLFIIIASAFYTHAQTHQDSVRAKRAKVDARSFKLKKSELKRFNTEYFPATSDYFNPTASTSAPELLRDSVYVQAYRTAAFYNAIHQGTAPRARDLLIPPRNMYGRRRPVYTSGSQAIAQNDAKKFSLGTDELEKFKARHYPNTSDYFKPTVQTASNPALLNDSVYVQTFRDEAFYKSLNQRVHPVGHALIIVGIVFAGLIAILATLAATFGVIQ